MAERRLGAVDEGCWSCRKKPRVSCGGCCAKTGKVSAQEAQYAGVARTDEEGGGTRCVTTYKPHMG